MADERQGRGRRSDSGNEPPSDPNKPITDEFGRTDPDTVERERRRREREERRAGGGKGRRKSRKRKAAPPGAAKEPTAEQPARPRRRRQPSGRREPESGAAPRGGGFAERAAAGRDAVRRRMGRGADPTSYRRRQVTALAGVLGGVLLIWFLIAFFQPFAGGGEGKGTVRVEIPEDAGTGEIADILDDAGVISSGALFEWRVKLAGEDGKLQSGDYSLASGMSYGKVIERLTGSTEGQISLVIPEGLSRSQVAELVAGEGIGGDYEAATVSFKGFNPAKYGAKKPQSLEGFLFPATYELDEGATVDDLVPMQLQAFEQNIKGVDMSYARKKNLTAYDVVIIASMIDREVMVPKERALVAAVIYNRLKRGQPLGIDATTRFETGNFEAPLTNEQLQTDSPYNTRTRAGLIPGPIGNPGIDAIKAAANPARVPFLFYVVKPGTCGEHEFVRTEAEFEAAVARYNAAREEAGGNSPTEC